MPSMFAFASVTTGSILTQLGGLLFEKVKEKEKDESSSAPPVACTSKM